MSEPDVDLLEDAIAAMVRASRTPPRGDGGDRADQSIDGTDGGRG